MSIKTKDNIIISTPSGKMQGIPCLTTSALENPNCQKLHEIENSICSHCYSIDTLNYRKYVRSAYQINSDILKNELSEKQINDICTIFTLLSNVFGYSRFESHGDIINLTHLDNCFKVSNKLPNLKFALYTKRSNLFKSARAAGMKKPSNLEIIASSPMLNTPLKNVDEWVNKVFTVYTFDYLAKHEEVKINCGARNCLMCGLCYSHISDDIVYVNEVLKSDSKKYTNFLRSKLAMERWSEQTDRKLKDILKEIKNTYTDIDILKMFS